MPSHKKWSITKPLAAENIAANVKKQLDAVANSYIKPKHIGSVVKHVNPGLAGGSIDSETVQLDDAYSLLNGFKEFGAGLYKQIENEDFYKKPKPKPNLMMNVATVNSTKPININLSFLCSLKSSKKLFHL